MKKQNKGFTLIEVLSVIVVLAIILSIAVPKILDVIEKSRRRAFFSSATSIVNTAKTEYSQNLYHKNFGFKLYEFDKMYPSGYKQNSETLKLKGDLPSIGAVKLKENGKIALAVVSHDERYCAKKGYSDAEVTVEDYVFGKCNIEADGNIIGEELKINIVATPTEWSKSKNVTITHNASNRAKLQYQLGATTGEWIDYDDTFLLEENTTIYARLYTTNNSIQTSLTVTTIDREGPEIKYSKQAVTTKSAKVYYTITDSKSGVDESSITCKYGDNYSKTGSVTINNNSVTCTMSGLSNNKEYKYMINAKDKVGNESQFASSVTTGDFSTIAISSTSTGKVYNDWSTSKKITIGGTLTLGTTLQYQLDTTTGNWINYTKPFEITKNNTTIYARITDGTNTSETATYKEIHIDITPPVKPTINLFYGSAYKQIGTYSNGTWTKYDVLTDVNSSDVGSGIAYYQYSHDKTTWSSDISTLGWVYAYSSAKNKLQYWITRGGSWNFYIRAVDNLGNIGTSSNIFTIMQDKTPPTTPVLTNSSGGNWTNQDVSITASSTDSQSGLAYYQYSYDTVSWNNFAYGNVDIWRAERAQPVYVRAVDAAGNISQISQTGIYIDKTAPIMWMRIDKNPDSSSSSPSAAPVYITSWAQDTASGVKEFKYWQSGVGGWKNDWRPNTLTYEDGWYVIRDYWTKEGEYTIWTIACDVAGNCTKDDDTTRPSVYINISSSSSSTGSSGSTSKPSKKCYWKEQTNLNVATCVANGGKLCASGSSSSCKPSSQNTPVCYKYICN